ncbi:MAG TPA: DNA primase [Aquificales bacterium]|nr:DNA primase [Aquificales bacterium]
MSIFDEIRRQLDIVEVISEYLPLKRVGNSYATRCPFHPDSTPSFYVSPSRGIWKCFGCGKGGDVIKFVAEYENLSYLEAAKLLAERYNLDIDFGDGDSEGKYYSALRKINDFYTEQLINSKEAKDFLIKERKFSPSVVKEFGLGYAGDGFKNVEFAKKEGIFETLLELKHFYITSYGRYRDFFHGRVTIPIKNILSKVVAFGGRSLKGELPKYKNSPNSEIFQKEKTLFGIERAKDYVKDRNYLILVEGYFDVIRLQSEGFGNTLAPLGTSLTLHHARVISKLTKRVILLFDGDTAGRRAVLESSKRLLKFPLEIYAVFLPPGEDPDSFVLKNGIKALRELLQSARPLRELLLSSILKASPEKRERYIEIYRQLVKEISDPVRADLWIKEFRDKTGINLFGKKNFLPIKKVEIPTQLTSYEVDFLLGLLYLRPEVDLNAVNLSPKARELAEAILRGEEEKNLPKWLFEVDTLGLERRFKVAKEVLTIDKPLLEETFKTLLYLEEKIKRGKATPQEIMDYRRMLSSLTEGERRLYKRFKEETRKGFKSDGGVL